MSVDLSEKLKAPVCVAVPVTDLRPGMIAVSRETKQMEIIEFTVRTEERIEVSGVMKGSKYEVLTSEAMTNGC